MSDSPFQRPDHRDPALRKLRAGAWSHVHRLAVWNTPRELIAILAPFTHLEEIIVIIGDKQVMKQDQFVLCEPRKSPSYYHKDTQVLGT